MTLKDRFLEAVASGELGEVDDFGVVVSLQEFRSYFLDVKSDYINSFLPAAVIETGQCTPTHTKYLFRIGKGLYRVHQNAIDEHIASTDIDELPDSHINNKIEEAMVLYHSYCMG